MHLLFTPTHTKGTNSYARTHALLTTPHTSPLGPLVMGGLAISHAGPDGREHWYTLHVSFCFVCLTSHGLVKLKMFLMVLNLLWSSGWVGRWMSGCVTGIRQAGTGLFGKYDTTSFFSGRFDFIG